MRASSQCSRTLCGIETEVVLQYYSDRVLVLVSQLGKIASLASIPSAVSIPSGNNVLDVEPPSSIQLTPLFGAAPTEELSTLHSLYASHISTLIWSLGQDKRNIIVGVSLAKQLGISKKEEDLAKAQKTLRGVMEMVAELLGN